MDVMASDKSCILCGDYIFDCVVCFWQISQPACWCKYSTKYWYIYVLLLLNIFIGCYVPQIWWNSAH